MDGPTPRKMWAAHVNWWVIFFFKKNKDLGDREEKVNLGETKEGDVGEYNQNTLYEILKTTNKKIAFWG